jgi:hypothetical protein
VAAHAGSLPPVSSLFASVLGVNPIQHLLSAAGVLVSLPAAAQRVLTGREFFPQLIAQPFHNGLTVVFAVAAGLAALAGVASLLRGGRYVHPDLESGDSGSSTPAPITSAPAPITPAPSTPVTPAPSTPVTSGRGTTSTHGTISTNGTNGSGNHITGEEHDGPDHPGRQSGPGRDRLAEGDHGHTRGASPR